MTPVFEMFAVLCVLTGPANHQTCDPARKIEITAPITTQADPQCNLDATFWAAKEAQKRQLSLAKWGCRKRTTNI
jgi:hypothetical protein